MDFDLDGRVAVVPGASKGIGLAVVRTLAEEGALVVAASRNRTAELDALEGVLHVSADLMDAEAPAELIARRDRGLRGARRPRQQRRRAAARD